MGGVIGVPDLYTVAYAETASGQIKHSLGLSGGGWGKAFDGLTHIYLHPLPYELYDDAKMLYQVKNPGPLSRMFMSREELYPRVYESRIERVLQSPWEGLTVDLTEKEGPAKLKKWLEGVGDFNMINFSEGFQYRLRRLENKYLIAIV